MLKNFFHILSSGSMIVLAITMEIRIIFSKHLRKIVGRVLINFSPMNMFLTMLLPTRFQQNWAASSVHGLKFIIHHRLPPRRKNIKLLEN